VFWSVAAALRTRSRQALRESALAFSAVAFVALAASGGGVWAKDPIASVGTPVVSLASLPPQAQRTHGLILSGGPFPYEKDGSVFGNRERLLPYRARGEYREYTVDTPGAVNRGARRIVCGGRQPTQPDTCYYTQDHYASFRQIAQ
jgi:ribonuclease T1